VSERTCVSLLMIAFRLVWTRTQMPNIAALLKSEISRVARREIRAEITSLKKAAAAHRHEIAALKQRVAAVEKNAKRTARSAPMARTDGEEEGGKLRFRAEGFAAHRKRLGLSAEAMGALMGVSGQSVYKWESGRARPRAAQLKAIAAIRKLGKREAQARLEQVQQ
jgi:DNA-binding transcriptional regulator YiaG